MAEAQAAEELRRKDPVKRGIWIASFLVLAVILWIAKLQTDIMFENSRYSRIDGEWKSKVAKYTTVTNNQVKTVDVEKKLSALDNLRTNRFLWGPVLNALQKTVFEDIQVTRIRGVQTFAKENDSSIGTGSSRRFIPGGMVEKDSLYIEAKDLKPNEQTYNKYKEALGNSDYFIKALGRKDGFVIDGTLGPLTVDPINPNRQFVTFNLVTHYPDTRRQ